MDKRNYIVLPADFLKDKSPQILSDFKNFLDSEIAEKKIDILEYIIDNEITEKDIFKRKKDFLETLKERRTRKN